MSIPYKCNDAMTVFIKVAQKSDRPNKRMKMHCFFQKALPWRWMALESLEGNKFSNWSDI